MQREDKLGKLLGPIALIGSSVYLIYKTATLVGDSTWKIYGCYFAALLLTSAAVVQIVEVIKPGR